jgi:hypothetical protein
MAHSISATAETVEVGTYVAESTEINLNGIKEQLAETAM